MCGEKFIGTFDVLDVTFRSLSFLYIPCDLFKRTDATNFFVLCLVVCKSDAPRTISNRRITMNDDSVSSLVCRYVVQGFPHESSGNDTPLGDRTHARKNYTSKRQERAGLDPNIQSGCAIVIVAREIFIL